MISIAKHMSNSSASSISYMLGGLMKKNQIVRVVGYNGFGLSRLSIAEIERVPTGEEDRIEHKNSIWKITNKISKIFDNRASLADYRVEKPFESFIVSCTQGERKRLRNVPTPEERKAFGLEVNEERPLERIILEEFLEGVGVHGDIEKRIRKVVDGKRTTTKQTVHREAMFLAVAHDGTRHPHFHILTARPDEHGKVNDTGFEHRRIVTLVRKLSKKYNLSLKLENYKDEVAEVNEGYARQIIMRDAAMKVLTIACSYEEMDTLLARDSIKTELKKHPKTGDEFGIIFIYTDSKGKEHKYSGSQLHRSLSYGNIRATLARNQREQQKEARRAAEAKVSAIQRICPVVIKVLKESCSFVEYKAKLDEFGITAERMLSRSADNNLMLYYTFTSDNVLVKGEELDEGLTIDNIEAMLAQNRRERQQKENVIHKIRSEAIEALKDSCTFDEYKAKLDKLGITAERMLSRSADGNLMPYYTFTSDNVLVKGEDLGEELKRDNIEAMFAKNLEKRQEYSNRIYSIYYNIIRPLGNRIMEIWESIFHLLNDAQANNVPISGKTHNLHLTSNELLKNRSELIKGLADKSLIDKGKTIAEVLMRQNLWINSAVKLLAQVAADIGKAGIEQKTALVGNIEKIQSEIVALERQKEQLTEDSIKPIRRYLVVNDCYNEYSQSRATINDAINSIQSDIKKAKEKEREQTNVKREKPTKTVVLEYNEGFKKAQIIGKDGIYKLQNYGVSFHSSIVNGKKQMIWETKAQFKSFKEMGRANGYLYLRIEEVTGRTRYINQYGSDLSIKILNQLGIGGGKGIHR